MTEKYTVNIRVKPYVKQYLINNCGSPCDLNLLPDINKEFVQYLSKSLFTRESLPSSVYNNDICVAAGVIDRDYYPREIGVLLYKVSSHEYKIKKGDRIAQLIVTNCVCQDTGEAERDGGFGSTGM